MRRRITRALVATAAAGATIASLSLAVAGSAGAATARPAPGHHHWASSSFALRGAAAQRAIHKMEAAARAQRTHMPSGGPPIYTPPCDRASGFQAGASLFFPAHRGGCAGYVGTGRNFRYVQAIIRIPAHPLLQFFTQPLLPTVYVGMSSNDSIAVTGVMTCGVYRNIFGVYPFGAGCPFQTWLAVGVDINTPFNFILGHVVALPNAASGQGIEFSLFYNQIGNTLHYRIDASKAGGVINAFSMPAHGAVFTHALALLDFSASTVSIPPSAPTQDVRATQFQEGAWTTAGGVRGTFLGPWTTQPVSSTFPAGFPPPGNTVTFEPSFLWRDGLGAGRPGDAFGVWWRH